VGGIIPIAASLTSIVLSYRARTSLNPSEPARPRDNDSHAPHHSVSQGIAS